MHEYHGFKCPKVVLVSFDRAPIIQPIERGRSGKRLCVLLLARGASRKQTD